MRLATFSPGDGGNSRVGAVLSDDRILDLTAAVPEDPAFASMLGLIDAGAPAIDRARQAIAGAAADDGSSRNVHSLASVRLQAPIPRPRKNVFCVGLNYPSHVEDNARALGIQPEI